MNFVLLFLKCEGFEFISSIYRGAFCAFSFKSQKFSINKSHSLDIEKFLAHFRLIGKNRGLGQSP